MNNQIALKVKTILKESGKHSYRFDRFHLNCARFEAEAFDRDGFLKTLKTKQLGIFLILAESSLLDREDDEEDIFPSKQLATGLSEILQSLNEEIKENSLDLRIDDRAKIQKVSEEDVRSAVFSLRETFKRPETVGSIITHIPGRGYKLTVSIERKLAEELTQSERIQFSGGVKSDESLSEETAKIAGEDQETTAGTANLVSVRQFEPQPAADHSIPEQTALKSAEENEFALTHKDDQTEKITSPAPAAEADASVKWSFAQKLTGFFIGLTVLTITFSAIFYSKYIGTDDGKTSVKIATISVSIAHIIALVVSIACLISLKFKAFRPEKELETTINLEDVEFSTGFKTFEELEKKGVTASELLDRFTERWLYLLYAWVALYFCLVVVNIYSLAKPDVKVEAYGFLFNLCSYANTVFIIGCFNILHNATVTKKETHDFKKILAVGATFIILLVPLEWLSSGYTPRTFKIISGIAGGIAMALFIGRMQSKFLNPRLWLLTAFYFYIVIQPLYLFVGDEKNTLEEPIVLHLAFILKLLLILYIFWLIETGRLLFYLVRVRTTKDEAEKQWSVFQRFLQ